MSPAKVDAEKKSEREKEGKRKEMSLRIYKRLSWKCFRLRKRSWGRRKEQEEEKDRRNRKRRRAGGGGRKGEKRRKRRRRRPSERALIQINLRTKSKHESLISSRSMIDCLDIFTHKNMLFGLRNIHF